MPTTHATAHAKAGMIARLNSPDYDRWAGQIRATGGCRQPIHLRGKIDHYDRATGRLCTATPPSTSQTASSASPAKPAAPPAAPPAPRRTEPTPTT
ncbi:hypothetical protein WBK31_32275 [Nonomuraea sp. N2-4H]|uniref:hypothetical protein n=1 Tax=Nonomuraea sp. N2-4H TaxID=3128898 RepID=UPI00324B03D8